MANAILKNFQSVPLNLRLLQGIFALFVITACRQESWIAEFIDGDLPIVEKMAGDPSDLIDDFSGDQHFWRVVLPKGFGPAELSASSHSGIKGHSGGSSNFGATLDRLHEGDPIHVAFSYGLSGSDLDSKLRVKYSGRNLSKESFQPEVVDALYQVERVEWIKPKFSSDDRVTVFELKLFGHHLDYPTQKGEIGHYRLDIFKTRLDSRNLGSVP